MKKKLRDIMEYVDYDDLLKMKEDLTMGGIHLFQLVDQQIEQEKMKHAFSCCICNAKIEGESVNNFTLLFGPEYIKRRATFCAIDCLEYFINNLKDAKRDVEKQEELQQETSKELR